MSLSTIAEAVWEYPTRTLASGTPDPPATRAESIAKATWEYSERIISGGLTLPLIASTAVLYSPTATDKQIARPVSDVSVGGWLSYPSVAAGVWSLEEEFETYTNGQLHGQGAWSGNATTFTVQSTVDYRGNKAVSFPISSVAHIIVGPLPIDFSTSGSVYFAVRRSGLTAGGFYVTFPDGTGDVIIINADVSGNIRAWDQSVPGYVNIDSYLAGAWYPIQVEADFSSDLFRVRVYNGGWGSFSAWLEMAHSATEIESFRIISDDLNGTGADTGYVDSISAFDITQAPTLYSQVDESSAGDTDYIYSTDTSTAKIQLGSISTPDSGDVILRVRHRIPS